MQYGTVPLFRHLTDRPAVMCDNVVQYVLDSEKYSTNNTDVFVRVIDENDLVSSVF